MITLYDYLPSQNAWKVRQILHHLEMPYQTEIISIFEGQGQSPEYLKINPWGAVPAIKLDSGQVLSESNALLWYLSTDTRYRPSTPFEAAKIMQWLSFEADYIQTSVGSLRYWTMTGKLKSRGPDMVDGKRSTATRALRILDAQLAQTPFICGDDYTIADISIFAYAHLAHEADLDTSGLVAFMRWTERLRKQDNHLSEMYPYAIDAHAMLELP